MNANDDILVAPVQGYTTRVWRVAHAAVMGCMGGYYAPFMRVEHGAVRRHDVTQVTPAAGEPPVVPQILAGRPDEVATMATLLRDMGYRHININMGCPHPPIAMKHRGSGILAHPSDAEAMLRALATVDGVRYSVKMRLGWDDASQWRDVLPLLTIIDPLHVIVHPRIGRQLYRGERDMEQFELLLAQSPHPIVYNGDIASPAEAQAMRERYSAIAGVMAGRAVVSWPHRFTTQSYTSLSALYRAFHDRLFSGYAATLQGGDHQLLMVMKAQWQLLLPDAEHRARKAIAKSNTLDRYHTAVAHLLDTLDVDGTSFA